MTIVTDKKITQINEVDDLETRFDVNNIKLSGMELIFKKKNSIKHCRMYLKL